jgi:hypothetical protein
VDSERSGYRSDGLPPIMAAAPSEVQVQVVGMHANCV